MEYAREPVFGIAPCPQFGVEDYKKHTLSPATTSTSVLALKFDKGVILAADILGSYGSLARFRDCPRLLRFNENIILGASGDYADYQYMKGILDRKMIDEECLDDGITLKPKSLYCWLTRILYRRRSKMDPLWNTYIVAGLQDGEPFIGSVDKIGTAFEDDCMGTGFGSYLAVPMMRKYTDAGIKLNEAEARKVIEKCMEVLYYRDARSFPKYQIAVVTEQGSKVEDVITVKSDWSIAKMVQGY